MPSSRTCAEASMILGPTKGRLPGSTARSPNWPSSSKRCESVTAHRASDSANATVPSPSGVGDVLVSAEWRSADDLDPRRIVGVAFGPVNEASLDSELAPLSEHDRVVGDMQRKLPAQNAVHLPHPRVVMSGGSLNNGHGRAAVLANDLGYVLAIGGV